ncbi:MAG: ATP-binding protein [Magnetococcus sp. DMHC-6]
MTMIKNEDEKPKLLLVDDMVANIMMLHEVLKDDYHTYFAKDGVSALKAAEDRLPDLILLDIHMPGMDGMEVCRRLKADSQTERIPIIFITSLSETQDETAGLELGAVDYITKPFNPTVVQLRVKNHIALKKYQDHLEELVLERTAKLQKAKEEAESADRAKTKFLMIISHELRTPLNSIIGFSESLSTVLQGESKELAGMIYDSGVKLNSMVGNILDLVKLESQKVPLACQPFHVRELVQQTARQVEMKYQEKGLVFESACALDVPEFLQGDEKRIRQVLGHLLDNAFKFTDKGSVYVKVERGHGEGYRDQLVFSVEDTGIGIPQEKLDDIFGFFTMLAEDMYTQHKGGIGIGLAICKSVVKLMNGKIWVSSRSTGSVFSFSVLSKSRLLCLFVFGLIVGGWQGGAVAEDSLRGPAFSDPKQLTPMPEEWQKKPIEYDAEAKKLQADVVITLDQEIFLMLGDKIMDYGKKKGIKIVNQEGTCGISDGFMLKKQVDLAGYCCAPSTSARLPTLTYRTLGIAAKVFIVHPDNPVNNLTVEQLQKIYQGEYARWSEVKGLEGAPNIPIHVVGRLHCKLRPGHWRLLLDYENMFSPRMKEVSTIPDVIAEVMGNPGSIGYDTMTNILRFQKKDHPPKVLRMEGQTPHDLDAIANLRYPLYRTLELASWEGEGVRNRYVDDLEAFMLKEAESLDPEKFSFVPASLMRKTGWQFVGDEAVGEPPVQKNQK